MSKISNVTFQVNTFHLVDAATAIDKSVRGGGGLSDLFNTMNEHMSAAENACGYSDVGSALWDAASRLHDAWGSLMGDIDMLAFRLGESAQAYSGVENAITRDEAAAEAGMH
jgi:hypothetical protein